MFSTWYMWFSNGMKNNGWALLIHPSYCAIVVGLFARQAKNSHNQVK